MPSHIENMILKGLRTHPGHVAAFFEVCLSDTLLESMGILCLSVLSEPTKKEILRELSETSRSAFYEKQDASLSKKHIGCESYATLEHVLGSAFFNDQSILHNAYFPHIIFFLRHMTMGSIIDFAHSLTELLFNRFVLYLGPSHRQTLAYSRTDMPKTDLLDKQTTQPLCYVDSMILELLRHKWLMDKRISAWEQNRIATPWSYTLATLWHLPDPLISLTLNSMNDAMYADFLKQHQKNTSEYAHLSTRKRMPTHTPIAGQTILDPQQVVRPQQHVQASLEILNLQKPLDDFLGPGLNEKDVNQPGPYQWRLYEPHLKLSPPLHPRRALESAQICPDLRMILIEYGAFKKWYSYNHILEICAGLSEPIPYQEVFCHLRRTIERFISLKNSLVSERSLPHHYPGTYETQATLKEQALLLQRHLKCS